MKAEHSHLASENGAAVGSVPILPLPQAVKIARKPPERRGRAYSWLRYFTRCEYVRIARIALDQCREPEFQGPTVIDNVPVALPFVPVIVAVPWAPTIVPELPLDMLMIVLAFELNVVELVTSVPFKVAVKVMAVPAGSTARLMGEAGTEVIVRVCAPTLTLAVPLMPLYVAVTVIAVVVFLMPVTTPVELRFTNVGGLVSELVQVASPVRFFVVPSL